MPGVICVKPFSGVRNAAARPLRGITQARRTVCVKAKTEGLTEAAKSIAAAGVAATWMAAGQAQAATELAQIAASDNRFGTISLLLVPVLGWVLFNIFDPAKNQLDNMSNKGIAAALGIAGASLLVAQSADAAEQVATLAASDNRFGTISLLLVPVLGWVLFNIFGPAKNQLDDMSKKGVAATIGITGASLLAAQSSDAAEQVATLAASDNRFGTISLLLVPVLGWVLFNIFGPAKNQLDDMSKKGVAATIGITGASLLAAQSSDAAEQVATLAASDNRFGTISLLLVPVLGWVLFNIFGPAKNQLDDMSKKGVAAAVGITGASLLTAQSSDAAEQIATLAASDNRFGIITLLFLPVVGWVLFNILGPTKNQLDNMAQK